MRINIKKIKFLIILKFKIIKKKKKIVKINIIQMKILKNIKKILMKFHFKIHFLIKINSVFKVKNLKSLDKIKYNFQKKK